MALEVERRLGAGAKADVDAGGTACLFSFIVNQSVAPRNKLVVNYLTVKRVCYSSPLPPY